MALTRKTILKRLEHINLASWHELKNIDQGVGFDEEDIRKSPFPDSKIEACLAVLGYQLWGVPSTKISVDDALKVAPGAGQLYIKPAYQRTHGDIWLNKMLSLMVLCSLREDDTELIRFSKWFRIKNLQTIGTPDQMAHQPILYYVADLFRTTKFESYEPLKECLTFFRVKEPSTLMAALDGIRTLDSKKTFDNLFVAAMDHAKRTNIALTQRPICQRDILAMYPSLLWNVAELRGLQPPTIPPEIQPFMLIRQTLGIPPIQAA